MKPFERSKKDKVISGVCGGIAEYLNVPSILVRAIFIFLPVSILVYALIAYIFPESNELY